MKRLPKLGVPRYERGLSLIELLVSITIGLVIMVAVVSAYVGASGAGKMEDTQGRMNEDAQAALAILSQHLRMAGNNPKQPNYANANDRNPVYVAGTTYIIRGCDKTFSDITTAANIQSLTCPTNGSTLPSIAVSYEADVYNTTADSGGKPTDCLGQALTAQTATLNVWNGTASAPTLVTYYVADNRFYIGTTGVIKAPSLYCKGNGGSNAQPLVENIEDMRFSFGTTAAAGTGTPSVAGYLSAASILTDTNLAALADDPTRWSKVIAVRICVLVRSENPVVSDSNSAQYVQCDGTTNTAPPDLRLRRAYTTTVVLRNRL